MGTRSKTFFYETEKDSKLKPFESNIKIYKQFDGYPTGLGVDYANILKGKTLVNGYNNPKTQLNGMECLAAYVISRIKTGCGNVYLLFEDTSLEEYNYFIYPKEETNEIWIQCYDSNAHLEFEGTPEMWLVQYS